MLKMVTTIQTNDKQVYSIDKSQNKKLLQINIQEKLIELSKYNDQIKHYKLIKCYNRSISSQSKQDGYFFDRIQSIFHHIPYHCTKYIKQIYIKKIWKKIINGIIWLLRYWKFQQQKYKYYIPKSKLYSNAIPETLKKSARQRKLTNIIKIETFGQCYNNLIQKSDRLEIIKKKREEILYKKSPIYCQFNKKGVQFREMKKRDTSLPNLSKKTVSLPPLIKFERKLRRIQRVLSNFAQ